MKFYVKCYLMHQPYIFCGNFIILYCCHNWWVLGKYFKLSYICLKALPFPLSVTWLLRLAPLFFSFTILSYWALEPNFFSKSSQSSRLVRSWERGKLWEIRMGWPRTVDVCKRSIVFRKTGKKERRKEGNIKPKG